MGYENYSPPSLCNPSGNQTLPLKKANEEEIQCNTVELETDIYFLFR